MQESFDDELYQQQKRKGALTNVELLELTYNDQKFIAKIHEYNLKGCQFIINQEFQKAMVCLDQAEKILEYAASCGKTIERSLITTILNNQAALLQRVWQLERSANYLQAIIYNITQFLESFPPIQYASSWEEDDKEYAQLATYFERKSALAVYHLRFCAVSSQAKNNQSAYKSAISALNILKELCGQMDGYERARQSITNGDMIQSVLVDKQKAVFRELHSIKQISNQADGKYLSSALYHISEFERRMENNKAAKEVQEEFSIYSIGHLMQTSPLLFTDKEESKSFMKKCMSLVGKIYKTMHVSIAYFTIATELRLIANSKYTLDDQQKKQSKQYQMSQLYHLTSVIIAARHLPCRSVYFDHVVFSFKNHYQINLLENSKNYALAASDSCIFQREEKSISNLKHFSNFPEKDHQKIRKSAEQNNNTTEIHESQEDGQVAGILKNKNIIQKLGKSNCIVPSNKLQAINTNIKKPSRSKPQKSVKSITSVHLIEASKRVDGQQRKGDVLSRNKENRRKSKGSQSNKKDIIKSRRKDVRQATIPGELVESTPRGVYYHNAKSRSKSKKGISFEKKLSRKNLGVNNTEHKRIVKALISKAEEEYGIKSATVASSTKAKPIKSYRFAQNGEYNYYKMELKMNKVQAPEYGDRGCRKVRSPRAENKGQNTFFQKKRSSKDKYTL